MREKEKSIFDLPPMERKKIKVPEAIPRPKSDWEIYWEAYQRAKKR